MQFGPLFYDERKARQDKMFISTLMLYCTSKSCKIQDCHSMFPLGHTTMICSFVGFDFEGMIGVSCAELLCPWMYIVLARTVDDV